MIRNMSNAWGKISQAEANVKAGNHLTKLERTCCGDAAGRGKVLETNARHKVSAKKPKFLGVSKEKV